MQFWFDSAVGLTVKDVTDRVKKWIIKGLIDQQIWTKLQEIVNMDLHSDFYPEPSKENTERSALTIESEFIHLNCQKNCYQHHIVKSLVLQVQDVFKIDLSFSHKLPVLKMT